MKNKQMLPIGIENFEKIRNLNYFYIDKTSLIKKLLENLSKVTLFTRPRRFGKSLNMSMLKYFFEIGTDPKLFDGLNISRENDLCKNYMGKFPVISISLKDVAGLNFDHARNSLNDLIEVELRRHQYLLESNKLSNIDKEKLENMFAGKMSNNDLDQSILTLSQMLHKHYDQKVVVLIDEYDVPLAKAFDYGYYEDMVVLIRNVLSKTLKTNESLQF